MLHLVFGNFLLGIGEGLLLAWVFNLRKSASVAVMFTVAQGEPRGRRVLSPIGDEASTIRARLRILGLWQGNDEPTCGMICSTSRRINLPGDAP